VENNQEDPAYKSNLSLSDRLALQGEVLTLREKVKAQKSIIRKLENHIDWLRQTFHRAHHEGSLDDCRLNTCDAALKILRKR
jgi:hypothetical protein